MRILKSIILATIVLLLSFGYNACTTQNYSKEIGQIDSLLIVAKEMNLFMLSIDSAEVVEKGGIVETDFKFVQDSLPGELLIKAGTFLEQLKIVKKFMDQFPNDYTTLIKESNYSINQLNELKKDAKHGLPEPKKLEKYLNDEKKAMAILTAHYQKLKLGLTMLNEKYLDSRSSFYTLYNKYNTTL